MLFRSITKQTNKIPQIIPNNTPKPILKTHKETEYMVYIKQPFTKGFENTYQGPYETTNISNNTVTYIKNNQTRITNLRRVKLVKIKNTKLKQKNVHFSC